MGLAQHRQPSHLQLVGEWTERRLGCRLVQHTSLERGDLVAPRANQGAVARGFVVLVCANTPASASVAAGLRPVSRSSYQYLASNAWHHPVTAASLGSCGPSTVCTVMPCALR